MPRTLSQTNNPASAQRISARKRKAPVGRTNTPSEPAVVVPRPGRLITVSKMIGDLPSFNDWMCHITDGNHLYMFGGCRPNDSDPTSDFYRWDVQTMEWTNLTKATRFGSMNPFGDLPATKPLPSLLHPSIASFYLGQKKFMLLFGGRIKKKLSSDLIAVNLEDLTWFIVQVDGDPVTPRMASSMVTVDNRVFIFGGVGSRDETLDNFCVAEYTTHDMKWRWVVRDEQYPRHVPSLGMGLEAISVYGGKKILLLAGRDDDQDPVSLSGDKCVLFHTTNHTFQPQSHTAGVFPKDAGWFDIGLLQPVRSGSGSPARSRRPSSKMPLPTSGPSPSSSGHGISDANDFTTPSVIISAWIRHGNGYLVPELWKYSLPPDETSECLTLREKLWALNLDLQKFVIVGGRSFLFGRRSDGDVVWNTCAEIFI